MMKVFEMLNDENQERLSRMLEGYAGSEGIAGRFEELYRESAKESGETLIKHIENFNPNEYIEVWWGGWKELN